MKVNFWKFVFLIFILSRTLFANDNIDDRLLELSNRIEESIDRKHKRLFLFKNNIKEINASSGGGCLSNEVERMRRDVNDFSGFQTQNENYFEDLVSAQRKKVEILLSVLGKIPFPLDTEFTVIKNIDFSASKSSISALLIRAETIKTEFEGSGFAPFSLALIKKINIIRKMLAYSYELLDRTKDHSDKMDIEKYSVLRNEAIALRSERRKYDRHLQDSFALLGQKKYEVKGVTGSLGESGLSADELKSNIKKAEEKFLVWHDHLKRRVQVGTEILQTQDIILGSAENHKKIVERVEIESLDFDQHVTFLERYSHFLMKLSAAPSIQLKFEFREFLNEYNNFLSKRD